MAGSFPGRKPRRLRGGPERLFRPPAHRADYPGEPVTGRYQAIVGPWTHGENVTGATLDAIKLEWFDTWLKDEPTGMAGTRAPLHLFENNAVRWVDTAAWPPSPDAQTYYLGDASLTASQPTKPGSDSLAWAAASTSSTLTYTSARLAQPGGP